MRFGETRDPAPTTMEELAPGGLLAKLSRMDVVARRAVRGARSGERRSRKRGGGLEFSEHRDYEPGDDLRFVDWNVFARLDRLVTKVTQDRYWWRRPGPIAAREPHGWIDRWV